MTDPLPRLTAALADRYRIERELGQGGMATVYLAEDLKHHRKVAIKVLKPELAAVLGAERFVQEITTTANLQHPHILPLFDSGTAGGFLFYVMPFIDGETLRSKLDRETQLGIDEAVRITCDVAEALDYAHRNGVVHRDIKPENILLHDGRPMVADFGIALAVSAAAGGRMTETGLSLGTPHYMSPEQATAEKEITARSDVYSLGSVCYEMLTGNPPHTGASAQQIIMKIVTEDPAPVTRLRKSVPPNVAAAVAKSLEKLPADRFESAKAFADALKNVAFMTTTLSGATVGARSARWKPALVAGLLLGAIGGAAAAWMWAPRESSRVEQAREQLTFNGLTGRPAISPAGDFVAFVETTCERSQDRNCHQSLMIQEVGSTQPRVLLPNARSLETPRWSHDGQTVVVAGQLDQEREGLFAIPRLTGTPLLIGPAGAYDTHPSADSVVLVPPRVGEGSTALVIDLRTGAVKDSFPVPFNQPSDVAWSPDGRHLAGTTGRSVQIVSRDGDLTASISISSRRFIRWSVDGSALLYFAVGKVREDEFVRLPVSRDGKIQGPARIVLPRVPTLYLGQFDVARRAGQLVLSTGDAINDLWSFDLSARPVRSRRETRGTTWYGYPALSPDGLSLYYLRGDALGDNVYKLDRTTGAEEALTAQLLPGGDATRLSADGRRLAYGHATDSVTRLEYITFPSRQTTGGSADVYSGLVVPIVSGGFLVQMAKDGRLAVLDSLGGTVTPLAIPDSLLVTDFASSPEGSRVVFSASPRQRASTGGDALGSQAGPDQSVLGVVSLATGAIRVFRALDANEDVPGLTWDRDGTVYLGRWVPGEDAPSIWRLSPEGGRLDRIVTVPTPCRAISLTVGALGQVAACKTSETRSDIWLIDAGALTR